MDLVGHNILDEAIIIATKAHSGQLDKIGQPYILHPIRVMLKVPSPLQVPAVLHDVLEDTALTELNLVFVGDSNLQIVKALTRNEGEKYLDYIHRVSLNPDAVIVKLADLEDNMSPERSGFKGHSSLMERYLKTYDILSKK